MNFSAFETKYWQKLDTKILLANYAQQKKLGIIPSDVADLFKAKLACCSSAEPSALETLAGESGAGATFVLADNQFCSPKSPSISNRQIIIRVAPLGAILSRVNMKNGLEGKLTKQLGKIMDNNADNLERATAEKRIRTAFGKGDFSSFEFEWPDSIKPFCALALEAKLTRGSGAGIAETITKQPRFISYLTDSKGNENGILTELKDGLATSRGCNVADFVRDAFGLDHLAKTYHNKPNILGFVAFQASQLDVYRCTRPTVFDNTSTLRFRGSNSNDVPVALEWGHTADLFKLFQNLEASTDESIIGCPEAVVDNPSLLGERHVLVGYLGPVEVPREDINDLDSSTKPAEYAKMQQLHEAFLDKCLTGMSPQDVYEAIFGDS